MTLFLCSCNKEDVRLRQLLFLHKTGFVGGEDTVDDVLGGCLSERGDEVFVHKSLSFGFEIIFATDYVLYESLYFFLGFY